MTSFEHALEEFLGRSLEHGEFAKLEEVSVAEDLVANGILPKGSKLLQLENDPPDMLAITVSGEKIGIEISRIVDEALTSGRKALEKTPTGIRNDGSPVVPGIKFYPETPKQYRLIDWNLTEARFSEVVSRLYDKKSSGLHRWCRGSSRLSAKWLLLFLKSEDHQCSFEEIEDWCKRVSLAARGWDKAFIHFDYDPKHSKSRITQLALI